MSPIGSIVPFDELTATVPYGAIAVWGVDEEGLPLVVMVYPGPPVSLVKHKGFSLIDGPHATRCPSCGGVIMGTTRAQCNAEAHRHAAIEKDYRASG